MMYYDVAVNFPKTHSILTYKSEETFQIGDLVEIPLGKRKEKGCIVDCKKEWDQEGEFPAREILSPIQSFQLDRNLLSLFSWMSRYYHYSLGKLIFDVLPPTLKRPRELNFQSGAGENLSFDPNPIQRGIIMKIAGWLERGHSSHLIDGVTGSGKTVIYLELIKKVMEQGQSVLFLLPEINLTPQFLSLFQKHISGLIYSYHSFLSNSDRFGLWKLLESDKNPKLILGARSSVFLPIRNLGLIVVDEEHDLSFKQEDRCSYHARNVALKRAQILDIPVVLGSATPSTDTLKLFEENKDCYYRMKDRVSNAQLPKIQLIDIRGDELNSDYWPISSPALDEMKKALQAHEQVLVFVNRLGYANYLQCRACGYQFFCPNCSVPLKYFKLKDQMLCQHCDYGDEVPAGCLECNNVNLLQKGFGTERVEEVLQEAFPSKIVKRFDRDELKTMKQVETRLNEFHQNEIDILVGTQMLSKGHNFKRVNLVLILGTDGRLSYPDFRSQEKVFQQILQVSGRAGRFGQDGRVLIQTYMPEAKIYAHIKDGDTDAFYQEELALRREYNYPPYLKMAVLYVTSRFAQRAGQDAHGLGQILKSLRDQHFKDVEVYGPRACNVEKRAGRFSQMLLLKSGSINQLHNIIGSIRLNFKPQHSTTLKVDIDPASIL